MTRTLIAILLVALILVVNASAQTEPVETPVSLNNAAVKLLDEGQVDEALKIFRRAMDLIKMGQLERDPVIVRNYVQALLVRSARELETAEYDAAERLLDEAHGADPKIASIHVYYGVLNYRQNQYDRAFSYLSEALVLDENHALAHQYLGFVHYRRESLERAIEAWKRAIEVDATLKEGLSEHLRKAERELEIESSMAVERSTHFICKYNPDLGKDVVDAVLKWLEDACAELGRDFRFYPPSELTVVLYSDREFSAATEVHAWAAGLFDGKVRIPVKNFSMRRDNLRTTIQHEYTHYVVSNLTRRAPAWLNEGLAQVYEGRKAKDVNRWLRDAVKAGTLPRLGAMGSTFSGIRDAKAAGTAYAIALSFTAWLIERYSISDLENFLRELKPKIDVDAALMQVFRRNLQELEAEWHLSF